MQPLDNGSRNYPSDYQHKTWLQPVEQTGACVSGFSVGDCVFGLAPFDLDKEGRGSYAEFIEVPDGRIAKMSTEMSFDHAAALLVAVQTACNALFKIGGLSSNHTILIHAAAGGVGHFAVQLAKWKGVKVFGTASGRNQEFLREIGVDIPIDYETMYLKILYRTLI